MGINGQSSLTAPRPASMQSLLYLVAYLFHSVTQQTRENKGRLVVVDSVNCILLLP